jgi:hypothetical protein
MREGSFRVLFVGLAAVRNAAFVAPAIAEALGVLDATALDFPSGRRRRSRGAGHLASCSQRPRGTRKDDMTEAFRCARTRSRRQFLASCMAAGGASPVLEACSNGERPSYEDAVAEMRRPLAAPGARDAARLRHLVRQATLAASSHNTQPWKFTLAERSIAIPPDFTRRTPVVDPDDHHLFVSLGCATENLVHAALARGLHTDVRIHAASIEAAFDDTTPVRSPLFEAIPVRQCVPVYVRIEHGVARTVAEYAWDIWGIAAL